MLVIRTSNAKRVILTRQTDDNLIESSLAEPLEDGSFFTLVTEEASPNEIIDNLIIPFYRDKRRKIGIKFSNGERVLMEDENVMTFLYTMERLCLAAQVCQQVN